MCEVHGMKGCNKEETKSASDKEPRYNGKDKKNVRQLLTDKKTLQEKARLIIQNNKKVQKEESAPAPTPITFPVTNSREGFKL
jgi:hypothetical protein